jgi:hypothetical protein
VDDEIDFSADRVFGKRAFFPFGGQGAGASLQRPINVGSQLSPVAMKVTLDARDSPLGHDTLAENIAIHGPRIEDYGSDNRSHDGGVN